MAGLRKGHGDERRHKLTDGCLPSRCPYDERKHKEDANTTKDNVRNVAKRFARGERSRVVDARNTTFWIDADGCRGRVVRKASERRALFIQELEKNAKNAWQEMVS